VHTTEWLLQEVHTDTTVDISQCRKTLIDTLESFCILNSNAKLPPQLFVGCIRWQIEPIKAETKQNSYSRNYILTLFLTNVNKVPDLALQQILSSIDLFLSYGTDSTDFRTM